ncbi:MAG TPA: hypothetical protein VIF62_11655 [Labilithrix sp.]
MTEKPAFDRPMRVLAQSRALGVLGLTFGALGIPAFVAFVAHAFPPGVLGLHVAILGLLIAAAVGWGNFRPSRRTQRVHATSEGVTAGGRFIARASIREGFFQPRGYGSKYGSSVRLLGAGGRVLFETEVDSEAEGIELLRVLGFDAKSHRAQFRGASPIYATMGGGMAWTFGVVFGSMMLTGFLARVAHVGPVAPFFFLPLVFIGMLPSRIVVGVDGVLVKWLWRARFIPMSRIRSANTMGDRAIALELTNGERVVVHTSMPQKNRSALPPQHRDAVLARVLEALETFREHGTAVDVSALVRRGSRSHGEWLEALRKLGAGEGGYREAALREDDLWRVVEDPGAPADARAGAAMVLKNTLDDAGRARVRVAAEATASPKLRVALESATAGADERLEEALAELGEEERASA